MRADFAIFLLCTLIVIPFINNNDNNVPTRDIYEAEAIFLKQLRPSGVITDDDFSFRSLNVSVADLKYGQVLVQLLVLSADPFQRGRMKQDASLLKTMQGFVAGKVVASKHSGWRVGDLFGSYMPYQTFQIATPTKDGWWNLTPFCSEKTLSLGVGVLGMPGATVYEGLLKTLRPKRGEILFVSSAAGAVGSLVGQVAAKHLGVTVIGSCGGARKVQRILKLGFHHGIDYKLLNSSSEALQSRLGQVAPEGIDMYFENVGGFHFDAAFRSLRFRGRIAVCGAISTYNEGSDVKMGLGSLSEVNIGAMIYSRQRIEGFLSTDTIVTKKWLPYFSDLLRQGKVTIDETFYHGIREWPKAFMETMNGNHLGKTVVRL